MRAHLSINVSDVQKSVEFYQKVFGVKPQKMTDNYAKFDLKNPSLNFSMQSGGSREISKVNHMGIEVDSAEAINLWENLLTERGVLSKIEENTECCFARQDKIWLNDPDGNSWEIFYVHEQLPVKETMSSCGPVAPNGKKCC